MAKVGGRGIWTGGRRSRRPEQDSLGSIRIAAPEDIVTAAARRAARAEILEKVLRGEMTPAVAEATAQRLGLGSFEHSPDPSKYDPLVQQWWSLPMAISWIIWRDPDVVRGNWDAFRAECLAWTGRAWTDGPQGKLYKGYELIPGRPMTYALMNVAFWESPDASPIEEARQVLWYVLAEGAVEVQATDVETGRLVGVQPNEWLALKWIEEDGRNILRADILGRGGYRDVVVRAHDIIRHWPWGGPGASRLPDTEAPTEPGYMPLYLAAQWIAAKGGAVEVAAAHSQVWIDAYADLLARVENGDVRVVGVRAGEPGSVDAFEFVGIEVDYPHSGGSFGLQLREDYYLRSHPYLGDMYWREGFDDSLVKRGSTRWSRLQVAREDVAKWWPFNLQLAPDAGPHRTGAPGRPPLMDPIKKEFARRCADRVARALLADEARELASWFAATHPELSCPTEKTIKNTLRAAHRKWKGPKL